MKNFIVFACFIVILISCSKETINSSYKSKGTITGQDLTLCACCGGYYISIDNSRYRFYQDSLIEASIHLSTSVLPVDVYLDWEIMSPTCSNDLINISKIKLAK